MFNYLISRTICLNTEFSRLSSKYFPSHVRHDFRVRDFGKSHNLKRKRKTIAVGARDVFLELIIEPEQTGYERSTPSS